MAPIGDFSARSLRAFVAGTSAPGARVITDWSGYCGLPDHDHRGRRCNARPSRADVDPSCVLEPKRWALGTFMACAAPICAATSTSSCSAGTAAATPQRRHPAASARASDPPTTATSYAADPGRPGASHRPPFDPLQSGPNTGPPACLTALETNFPKSKSSRTSPGTVAGNVEINIWCDRMQRDKPYS